MRRLVGGLLLLALVLGAGPGRAADGEVLVVFVGDVMVDDGPGETLARGEDPLAAFEALLEPADLVVGNLECAVATGGAPLDKPWTFRARPEVVPWVARSFDAVSLANNHSGDYGRGALLETLDLLAKGGVPAFGAGRDLAAAHAPVILERGGLRIALLGYDEFKPRAFEATSTTPGVAWSEDEQVIADIRTARERYGADLVIPFLHWGWEGEPEPCARQRALARRLVDAGADAVIGGHPHLTQPAELYRGRLIVHSLGNFVFDGFPEGPGRVGWMLRLSLDRRGMVRFDTVVARLDAEGTPRPDLTAESPCGARGDADVRMCRGGLGASASE